jgi:Leucine-rich repeat (LRR) protein
MNKPRSIRKAFVVAVIFAGFSLTCREVAAATGNGREQPNLWRLLRKNVAPPVAPEEAQGRERVVHFPADRSIGRLIAFKKPPPSDRFWHGSLGWGTKQLGEARGDVVVPAGTLLRLDVQGDARRAVSALDGLAADDIQLLNCCQAKNVNDNVLAHLAHLTGLEVLFLGEARVSRTGLRSLTALKNLKALQLPPDGLRPEDLSLLAELPCLEYLNPGGRRLTDAALGPIGKLRSLTQLILGGTRVGPGLAHLENLKSLRSLNLKANTNSDINRHLVHIAGLSELERLDLSDTLISDAGMVHLKDLVKLKKLDLFCNSPNAGKITHVGLAHLKNLKALKDFRMPSRITDESLVVLSDFDSLRSLNLWGGEVTDKGMAFLPRFKSLTDVDICSPKVTDAGIKMLLGCPKLTGLSIQRAAITDEALVHIAEIRTLRYLSLWKVPISSRSFAHLRRLPSLRELDLTSLKLDPSFIDHLSEIRSLERLKLCYLDTEFTDQAFASLGRLTSLNYLDIMPSAAANARFTDSGLTSLSNLKNLTYLSLAYCRNITDKGLASLEGLSSLKQLRLFEARVTMAGVKRLQEKIPGLTVTAPCKMQAYEPRIASPAPQTGLRTSQRSRTPRRRPTTRR